MCIFSVVWFGERLVAARQVRLFWGDLIDFLFTVLHFYFLDSCTGGDSHDLSIQRYAVIPLSPTAGKVSKSRLFNVFMVLIQPKLIVFDPGLISWVPNSDTLHDLIRDYRESRKVLLNVEHKLMQQMAPNNTYDSLTPMGKLEVFEHALANTSGDDLGMILWLKSGWVDATTTAGLWQSCQWWVIFWASATDTRQILCWTERLAKFFTLILVIASKLPSKEKNFLKR